MSEHRLETLEKWTSGEAYDQWMGRWSQLLAERFLQWLDIRPNLRWLDVCCGSGIVTEAITRRCSPASVAGIDVSPEQIEFARAHRGRSHATFQVGDAMNLPFPAGNFDVVVCGLGMNYIPQPERALREMRRTAVRDGLIAAYVWDYAEGARFIRKFWDTAKEIDPDARRFDQASRFPLCTAPAMQNLFEKAGLVRVTVHAVEVVTHFANFEDYWKPLLGGQGSAPRYAAQLAAPVREAIRDRLKQSLPTDAQGAIELPARAWAVRGQCPRD